MGDSEDDAVHKIPHKLKTHWQNKLKFSVLVWFAILYRTSYKKIDVRLVQCPFNMIKNDQTIAKHEWFIVITNWEAFIPSF